MDTRNIDALPDRFSVEIRPDGDGYLGRECPNDGCAKYFKITPGTWPQNVDECCCPYCGTKSPYSSFITSDQKQYARSVVRHTVTAAFLEDLKGLEYEHRPSPGSAWSVGTSRKVHGQPAPIQHHREKQLETEVVCETCGLRYSIYGVFGHCPACGAHNSLQMLETNLALIDKMLALAEGQADPAVATKLVENALEDCVSSFDGWGRATANHFSSRAVDPEKARHTSFQNLEGAMLRMAELFRFELTSALASDDFRAVVTSFQKRHLLAHSLGVIDQSYIDTAGDPTAVLGRKVRIDVEDVRLTVGNLRQLARGIHQHLGSIK